MSASAPFSPPQQRLRNSRVRMGASLLGALAFLWLLGELLAPLPAPIGPAAQQFVDGARTTVSLTLVSGVLGLGIGLALGLGKMAESAWLRLPSEFFIWIIRGTPLLTQLLFFYLAMPALLPGLQWSEYWTAVAALAINVGAYNAEVFRAGVQSVPRGQLMAARALGMRPSQAFRFVVLPLALRVSLPSLANNVVALLKDSSLAYAIGVVEINMIAQRVQADSFQPVPVFITTAVIYLILTTALTQFSTALEERMAASPR
ncbi:amino acid ABC transporter permease [Limnohabitans sp. DM1]|uniref:amino acid ABC transporter permease n=1 Tax=Limnohabitans sp. DM1 TaxID=1597955 RepID=UPI000B237D00|nr:amino acid ABC transporter permease [Limnohabitans sp. DM1]